MLSQPKNALDVLFPDRPKTPLPPTLDISQLAGTYNHPGYGPLVLREEPHPDKPDEKTLVSDREGTSWSQKWRFHHVSGDFWIAYIELYTYYMNTAVHAEFKFGVDGRPMGVEVELRNQGANLTEAIVLFKRE